MKNGKIVIPIIIIIIAITSISLTTLQQPDRIEVEDTLDKELKPQQEMTLEIQEKLDEIEKNNSENNYKPKDREWITSGPFQIDRTEYVLGEKIFLRIGGLQENEIGQVAFLMPSNGTHYTVYLTVPFNGAAKTAFNYYIEPDLSATREICSIDQLVGDWKVVFRGTEYSSLEFKITEEILPGDEESYKPVC